MRNSWHPRISGPLLNVKQKKKAIDGAEKHDINRDKILAEHGMKRDAAQREHDKNILKDTLAHQSKMAQDQRLHSLGDREHEEKKLKAEHDQQSKLQTDRQNYEVSWREYDQKVMQQAHDNKLKEQREERSLGIVTELLRSSKPRSELEELLKLLPKIVWNPNPGP